jgi:Flp pilus assembly protein TadD
MQGEVKSMPAAADGAGPVAVVLPPRRFPIWMLATFGVVLIAALVGGFFLFSGRSGRSSLDQGIAAYKNGQREAAVSAFSRAVREDKSAALPHVYLARMAREVGNFTLASQELQLALEAEPSNPAALREMGANLLAQGNYELARRFYIRAVQADPSDKTSQGYLGCALMRLNRVSEATTFLNRAGPGPWSNCTPATTQNQAGQVVTPGAIPR